MPALPARSLPERRWGDCIDASPAAQIRDADPTISARKAERVADVYARLFVTYVAFAPTDPDPHDDKALRKFADAMLVPLLA